MSVIRRGIVFVAGTTANVLLFLVLSRGVLEIIAIGESVAGTGPATPALNLLPVAFQLGLGGLQVGLILYFIGGLGEERAASRGPV